MSKNNIDIYDAIPSVGHLIEENIKLKKENQELKKKLERCLPKVVIRHTLDNVIPNLEEENTKLKQAIKILKDKFKLDVSLNIDGEFSVEVKINKTQNTPNIVYLKYLEIEQYELLKEVFESVGDSDE